MAIIAISSVTRECSIFIKTGKGEFFSANKNTDMVEYLPSEFKRLSDESGLHNEMIEKLIISSGPGFFTGQRIGESFAKGILAGDEASKLLYVNSMDVLAYKAQKYQLVMPVLRCRKGFYHTAFYENDGITGMKRKSADLIKDEAWLKKCFRYKMIGDGMSCFENGFEGIYESEYESPDAYSMFKYVQG